MIWWGTRHPDEAPIGHRLDSQQRESSMNQLQMPESQPLRCPMIEENARACATIFRLPAESAEIADCLAERGGLETSVAREVSPKENLPQYWRISRRKPLAYFEERVRFQFGAISLVSLEFRCRENPAGLAKFRHSVAPDNDSGPLQRNRFHGMLRLHSR